MKTTIFALLLLFLASTTFAQDYAFKVLASKGSNEVKAGGSWAPLKTGATLRTGDELRLSENAYLGMVHVKGKPVELKLAGTYKVAELAAKVGAGASVLNKYTDFILSSNSAEAKKNRLSATGAVDRGDSYPIKLILPNNQSSGIYNNIAIINWEAAKTTGPYTVTLRNMFDDELGKFETAETTYKLDLADPKLAKENAILIEIKSKKDPKVVSKQHLIKRITPAEHAVVKKSLAEISADASEVTALNKLLLAGFYEERNLLIDAIVAYEEAISLAPDVPTFKESYDDFLLRHGMK